MDKIHSLVKNTVKKIDGRDVIKALFVGFVLAVIFSFLPFFAASEDISDNVLRLHIIANSDSPQDQALKLKVRDVVLKESAKWYKNADSFEDANAAVCLHLGAIQRAAAAELEKLGVNDKLNTEVTEMYFSTRDYESFSLPAGKYRTLRVTIGDGKGKNWWCMVYPSLCLPVADDEKSLANMPQGESEIITNPGDYKVRFKLVEWYEQIRSFFDK